MIKGYRAIMPNVNMICNIGIGADATHTKTEHPFANNLAMDMEEITHPLLFLSNVDADIYTQNKEYYKPVVKKNLLSRTWKKVKERIKN
jgi:hypothetical protein